MNRTSCKDTEIQFGRDDQDTTNLEVWTRPDGTVGFLTGHPEGDERYIATLGQAIQLRDFLNRHIDGLALAATGSLAVRSSDDPSQLASVEVIDMSRVPVPAYSAGERREFVLGAVATSIHREPPLELDDPDVFYD